MEVMDLYDVNPYTTPMEIWTTMDRTKQNHVNSIMDGKESPVTGLTYEWQNDVVDAGISVIDVKTGALVAVGIGRHRDQLLSFNNATDIENQIGSTAKPLYDYGPGIEYNNWSTYTPFADEPHAYSNGIKIENWNMKLAAKSRSVANTTILFTYHNPAVSKRSATMMAMVICINIEVEKTLF